MANHDRLTGAVLDRLLEFVLRELLADISGTLDDGAEEIERPVVVVLVDVREDVVDLRADLLVRAEDDDEEARV